MSLTTQPMKWFLDFARRITGKRKALKQRLRQQFSYSNGEKALKERYRKFFSKDLNTDNPQSFSEKIFCKMLAITRKNDPLLTRLCDKYLVREWVESKIGSEYLAPLLWQGNDPSDIPFDSLPERCVIKTNHASNRYMVKNGPIDCDEAREKLRGWLAENYYWFAREHQYYNIRPTVIIEEFLSDGMSDELLDYRFWCFKGKVAFIQLNTPSRSIHLFYDSSWSLLDLRFREKGNINAVARPENFSKMLEIAETLSSELDFVRVDLYNIKGKIFFSEMTFTPRAGAIKFHPADWDLKIGRLWKLAPKYQVH